MNKYKMLTLAYVFMLAMEKLGIDVGGSLTYVEDDVGLFIGMKPDVYNRHHKELVPCMVNSWLSAEWHGGDVVKIRINDVVLDQIIDTVSTMYRHNAEPV